MATINRSWLFFGLSAMALASATVLVGMTNARSSVDAKAEAAFGLSGEVLDAKNTLRDELVRRFTDPRATEFGMGRVAEPMERHRNRAFRAPEPPMGHPAVMDQTQHARGSHGFTIDRRRADVRQVFVDNKWINARDYKPSLRPETKEEEAAVATFKESNVDVAIYTVGRFEMDKGEKPDPSHTSFTYAPGDSLRLKGPAYLGQDSQVAPTASELVDFGRLAWASKQNDYVSAGKDGWVYFAHRVDATDESCGRCHGDLVKGVVQQKGDSVGLFVIALRHK